MCTRCCQLCGDPSLDDCADCRGEEPSDEDMNRLVLDTYMLALFYAYARRTIAA